GPRPRRAERAHLPLRHRRRPGRLLPLRRARPSLRGGRRVRRRPEGDGDAAGRRADAWARAPGAAAERGRRGALRLRPRGRDRGVDADRDSALPFNQLKRCELSVELPPSKRRAITELAYGTNTKVFITTAGRPWRQEHSSGTTFHDGGIYQQSWESVRSANTDVALLTAFSGGRLGVSLGESNPEA
ncbi:MAG: FAD-dependent oxidoreductase, partial [Deltaproteobacteria bacterium]|nr:FAD-dependent oxidoreductase [Deltaproteobacteria bacterium]